MTPVPAVLCLSGHDPTGGAGIQADIEACAAHGIHAFTVITAHTVQDTSNVRRVSSVPPQLIAEQVEALLQDGRIAAVKIGLLGDALQVPVIANAIRRAAVPVVLDPVLRAGGGTNLVGSRLQVALVDTLVPLATVLTPNAAELRRLVPGESVDGAAARLLAAGCRHVLVTGGDEDTARVVNTWYAPGAAPRTFEWPRLPETFHGAGCTLASAIAARLALGDDVGTAIESAQRWTQAALAQAVAVGQGRRVPLRRPAG
jgi:hydroxymethylpyrimidine/phosphomethylpyrimidine kinase